MADLLTGRTGSITLDASVRCDISSFTANRQDAINTTTTGCSDGWQITARGNRKVSGSLTFKVENTDPVYVATLDSEISTSGTTGLVAVILTGDSGRTWSGNARLGGANWSVNIESAAWQECTVPFESDGAWTFT